MTIGDKIRDEIQQYNIKGEVAKISARSSGKIDKYKYYLTDDEIIPPDQGRVIEQAKFAYSPLGTAFEKQKKLKKEKNMFKLQKF